MKQCYILQQLLLSTTLLFCCTKHRAVHSFVSPPSPSCRAPHAVLFSARGDKNWIEAASVQLEWEKLQEKQDQPILNLSGRDASPEEDSTIDVDNGKDWKNGQQWHETKQHLLQLLNCNDEETIESFRKTNPQLCRLETAQIIETATWLLQEFGSDYVLSQPQFLLYRCVDVQYGLDFMSKMMMVPSAKAACQVAPAILQSGIDGGIQEQYVKKALGDASAATYSANQQIASTAMATLNAMKNNKNKKT